MSAPLKSASPAFAEITENDHRGSLWIAAILSFIYVVLTLGARLYVRKHMLGPDDYACIAAVAIAVGQYITVFVGMPLGLGTSKEHVVGDNGPTTARLFVASEALFVAVLYTAKFAVLLATERLLAANMRTVRNICLAVRGIVGVGALASILTITVGCGLHGLVLPEDVQTCSAQTWRWAAVAIVDGVTELCILGVFCSIIWSLKMRSKLKMTLTILLGLRIVVPIFTGIHASTIASFVSSSNPAVRVISPLVWQQVIVGYSLISALLIALMPFLKSFHTGMGVDVRNITHGSSSGRGGSNNQYGGGYRLEQLSKNSRVANSSSTGPPEDEQALASSRWTSAQPRLVSTSKSRVEAEAASTEPSPPGKAIGIQKTVDWSVQYEEDDRRYQ